MADDLHSWAAREGLSADIVQVVLDEDFTTLDDLKELSPDDLSDIFQKTQLLKGKQFLLLKKAISRLPVSPSQTSSPATLPASDQSAAPRSLSADMTLPVLEPSSLDPLGQGDRGGFSEGTRSRSVTIEAPLPRFSQPEGMPSITPATDGTAAGQTAASKPKKTGIVAGLKSFFGGSSESEPKEEFRILMLGKTGSGKSTTGNTILGEKKFVSQLRFSSVTTECDLQKVEQKGRIIEIMDCPGLYDTKKSQAEISAVIVQAVACMHPGPHVILYVIRLGRYTEEEFGVFKRLKALFDERITQFMILLFTGGDDLENAGMSLADMMKGATPDLVQVAIECGHRCHVFNNTARYKKPQVDKLLDEIRNLKTSGDQPYYVCPRYDSIGDGLEKEVQRRLAEVTKQDLEREEHILQLEAQTKAAKAEVERMKDEMEKKEEERALQEREENERKEEEMKRLRQELKDREMSEETRKIEEKELQERLEREKEEFQRKMEEQRREERQRLEETQREKEKLEEKKRQEEKEEQERKKRAYEEEMYRTKSDVAKDGKQDFLSKAASEVVKFVSDPIGTIWSWFS